MTKIRTCPIGLAVIGGAALLLLGSTMTSAAAVEPEKQPIFANVVNGLLCGTSTGNQCKVPAGERLIIEYVSGFVFEPPSAKQTSVVSMAVTDPVLSLNGASFHTFATTKVNSTPQNDVFAFSAPLKMMLHPNASFYFSNVAGISVSGYLVKFAGN